MVEIIGRRKPKIFFGIGVYDHWEFESQQSIVTLQQERRNWEVGQFRELYGCSEIQMLRNTLALDFLDKTDDDYFFQFDVDIVCYTEAAIDLLVAADKPIIGGAYIYRKAPFKPTFVTWDQKYDLRGRIDPFEVKFVSGGFMLIKRKVLEDIRSKYPEPFNCYQEGDTFISEDWSASVRAREFGYKTYLHPKIELGHLGKYPYGMRDYYQLYVDRKDGGNGKVSK